MCCVAGLAPVRVAGRLVFGRPLDGRPEAERLVGGRGGTAPGGLAIVAASGSGCMIVASVSGGPSREPGIIVAAWPGTCRTVAPGSGAGTIVASPFGGRTAVA